jgi:protein-L-isoaspartate(D-aspartate) O-methyltransferase
MIEAVTASPEERGALLLAIRRAGVRDLSVLRAIEATPREAFTPYRYRDLANRNISLPIGCGQTMSRPVDLAKRIAALGVGPGHRVLEVGAGSGYSAAILSRLAGEVVSFERYRALAIEASAHVSALAPAEVRILHNDGLAPPSDLGRFDRIFVEAALQVLPQTLLAALATDGILLYARAGSDRRQRLIKLVRNSSGEVDESDLGPCRLAFCASGVAYSL